MCRHFVKGRCGDEVAARTVIFTVRAMQRYDGMTQHRDSNRGAAQRRRIDS
jgi:hypothetical protein